MAELPFCFVDKLTIALKLPLTQSRIIFSGTFLGAPNAQYPAATASGSAYSYDTPGGNTQLTSGPDGAFEFSYSTGQ